ncbi:MAG: hypothetical protein MUC50_23275 [Myxococcota bacterium]|jgi:hypothetical protein|nr:hypothetical protein [Myxococcota bacterium]
MYTFSANPFDDAPHGVFDDEENGRKGRLELRYAFFVRTFDGEKPFIDPSGVPVIETAAVLTKIDGYGTTGLARLAARAHFSLIQERSVTELCAFHNWLGAVSYSLQAKEIMFGLVANPLIRRRLKEGRILVEKGLFSVMVDAGLRLSGVQDARVMNDEVLFNREAEMALGRYAQRPGFMRLPIDSSLIPSL